MISKPHFINRHKHELLGLVFEGLVNYQGRQQSMFVELAVKKIEVMLARVYDDKIADGPPASAAGVISKQQFINRHKHELLGLIFESLGNHQGRQQSMFVDVTVKKVEVMLARVYDDKIADEQPPPASAEANGSTQAGPSPQGAKK